jgi:hypothetical protein
LRKQRGGPRVQQGHIDNDEARLALAQALPRFAGTEERLDRWLRWADRTDGAIALNGHDYERLAALRAWAEQRGYLSPQTKLPPMERHEWTEIPDLIKQRSTRILDAIASSPRSSTAPDETS